MKKDNTNEEVKKYLPENILNKSKTQPLLFSRGFLFIKFLFSADMLAQHRLLKIVKGEKNVDSCQIVAKFYLYSG